MSRDLKSTTAAYGFEVLCCKKEFRGKVCFANSIQYAELTQTLELVVFCTCSWLWISDQRQTMLSRKSTLKKGEKMADIKYQHSVGTKNTWPEENIACENKDIFWPKSNFFPKSSKKVFLLVFL